jgi:N-acetylneuraminic acid mutarotase
MVVCEDKLYVVGGRDADGTVLDSVEVYDFGTETWSILPAPMPQARGFINKAAVVQHKSKVYVVGGYGREGGWLRSVAVCDIAAEEWSVLPVEMIVNRGGHAAAVHGNKIYVLGGYDEAYTSLRSVEVYDITAGGWSMMPGAMHVDRDYCAVAVHGDTLYAIGGYDDDARHTMEVLALPPLLPWTPTRHFTFPNAFKRAVSTLMHCFARTNDLPDDVLFKIIWLLLRTAFKQPALV